MELSGGVYYTRVVLGEKSKLCSVPISPQVLCQAKICSAEKYIMEFRRADQRLNFISLSLLRDALVASTN